MQHTFHFVIITDASLIEHKREQMLMNLVCSCSELTAFTVASSSKVSTDKSWPILFPNYTDLLQRFKSYQS